MTAGVERNGQATSGHEHDLEGVTRVPVVFVNAYLVQAGTGFVLVDTGLRGAGAALIRRAVAQRFGADARPRAIVLTHGHFDHAGSAHALAHAWQVPVYAHRLELPYLTGRSSYPPQDPSVGGTLANLSRVFPRGPIDLGSHVREIAGETIPELDGWRVLHTAGHTPGHISLYRERDGLLLAGDAVATMDQESPVELFVQHRQLRWPPATFTPDWDAARQSVERLAELRPAVIAAGHGLPMAGEDVPRALDTFARAFSRPSHGRYVHEAARADERGVIHVPPPVPDPTGRVLRTLTATLALAGAAAVLRSRRRTRR